MSSTLPAERETSPTFVALLGAAADAATGQGIPCSEAIARAAFAIEAHYAAAGLPTPLDKLEADYAAYQAKWGATDGR